MHRNAQMKKMIARVATLCVLISSPTFCKAESLLWCAPDVVTLTFKDQENRQDQKLARIELRSLKPVCGGNPEKEGFGVRFERSIRIEQNGQWIEVPSVCTSGVSFGVDGLSLSFDAGGLGAGLAGRSTDREDAVKVMIYKLRDKVLCARVEPCPNQENKKNECLRWLVQ
jgi:hypothetical protein